MWLDAYTELLVERQTGTTYYHGTRTEKQARSILQTGLQPPANPGRHLLSPIEGRVYLTPSLYYAAIYAIGGILFGSETNNEIEKYGRYGFIFEISDAKLVNSIWPDEDEVGEAMHYLLIDDKSREFYRQIHNERPYEKNLPAYIEQNPDFKSLIRRFIEYYLPPHYAKKIKEGLYAYYAAGGKSVLKKIGDYERNNLTRHMIAAGGNVGHQGPIDPDRAYRIDRTRTREMTPETIRDFLEPVA